MENHAEEKPHRCPKCSASFNVPVIIILFIIRCFMQQFYNVEKLFTRYNENITCINLIFCCSQILLYTWQRIIQVNQNVQNVEKNLQEWLA